jgi:uncharacterized protein YndB with AHSA1/START domain
MTTITAQTTQVYSVFIKATPEQVWEAITTPEFSHKYFHGARLTVTPDSYNSVDDDGTDLVSGTVLEFDPPRRLVHTWRALYSPELAAEDESRVTWEIAPRPAGPEEGALTYLTVTHDQLEGAPLTAVGVSGEGWTHVLSGLKTLLETGEPLFG